jgi:hypothetical protein
MTQAGSFGIPSNGVRAVPCRHRDGEPMERVRQPRPAEPFGAVKRLTQPFGRDQRLTASRSYHD